MEAKTNEAVKSQPRYQVLMSKDINGEEIPLRLDTWTGKTVLLRHGKDRDGTRIWGWVDVLEPEQWKL